MPSARVLDAPSGALACAALLALLLATPSALAQRDASAPLDASAAPLDAAAAPDVDAARPPPDAPRPPTAPSTDAGALPPDASVTDDLAARRHRAAEAFALGTAAYHRGEFDQAAAHFQEAYDALPDPAPLYNIARSRESAHDILGAIDAFEHYLREAPHAPDRDEVSDHIRALNQHRGDVFVASDPAGAQVFVDENPRPEPTLTPVVLHLPPGPHLIVLDRPGHQHVTRRFYVRPGSSSTYYLRLLPDPGTLATSGSRGRVDPRVLNRRSTVLFSPRFSFLFGAARPWNDPLTPLNVTIGAEASVFVGRSLSAKLHLERVEPSGAWTIVTADFGYVLPFEDLDIGAYLFAGTAYGWIDLAAEESGSAPGPEILAGGELRVDWVFHHHLAIGAFFRAAWRNLLAGGGPESLNSFGLSVSLFL